MACIGGHLQGPAAVPCGAPATPDVDAPAAPAARPAEDTFDISDEEFDKDEPGTSATSAQTDSASSVISRVGQCTGSDGAYKRSADEEDS